MKPKPNSPPRLLYWADLPVSPSGAGAILMHRLLEAWPAEKLMVVTPNAFESCTLPGVRKAQPPTDRWRRLYTSRIALPYMTARTLELLVKLRLSGGRPPHWLRDEVRQFAPQAILTAGVAGAWIRADALAQWLGVPLHVIIHDDHHYAFFWIKSLRNFGEQLFGKTYRRACSRLCVSEPMREEYRRRFGAEGEVLLPSRGRDSLWFGEPRADVAHKKTGLNVVYAGSLYGRGFEVLEQVGAELARHGHRLVVYTPSQPPPSLALSHLDLRAPLPSQELVQRMHDEADILLLWTDFSPANREVVRTLFPSKMVDYTAAAVPIVVVAPQDACIVQFLSSSPEAAELLTTDQPEAVSRAVEDLALEPDRRMALARGAVTAGHEDFSYERAWNIFTRSLAREREALPHARSCAPVVGGRDEG